MALTNRKRRILQVAAAKQGGGVLPEYQVLAAFNTLSGISFGANTVGSLDTLNNVEGTGALCLAGDGTNATLTAEIPIGNGDPANLGVIAFYVNVRSERDVTSIGLQIGRAGVYSDLAAPFLINIGDTKPRGGFWFAGHASEFTNAPSGAGALTLKLSVVQAAPYAAKVSFDAVASNIQQKAKLALTFDDLRVSQYSEAFAYMQPKGLKGTCYVPSTYVGQAGNMTLANLQEMYAAGWDMACDSTDDGAFTEKGSLGAALTNVDTVRTYLTTNGMPRAADHLCYPNGWYSGSGGVTPATIQAAAMTGDGGKNVSLSVAPSTAVAVGMFVYGAGVPEDTFVETVTDTTHFTLSKVIPAQTKPAQFVDPTPDFYMGRLSGALKNRGYKTGRTTRSGGMFTKFGFADQALLMNGQTTSDASFATLKALVDTAVLRKTSLVFYIHALINGGGSINLDITVFRQLIDYAATLVAAGLLDVVTISDLYAQIGAGFPGAVSHSPQIEAETQAALDQYQIKASDTQVINLNTLIKTLKDNNVAGKIDTFGVTAVHDKQAVRVNLKNAAYVPSNVGGTPSYTPFRGIKGDGSAVAQNINFNPSAAVGANYQLNSAFLGVGVRTARAGLSAGTAIGARSSSNLAQIETRRNTDLASISLNQTSTSLTFANTDNVGRYYGVRSASNVLSGYKDGVLKGTSAAASAAMPNLSFYLGGRNTDGSLQVGVTDEIWFWAIGGALTDAEVGIFDAAMLAYGQAVGAV